MVARLLAGIQRDMEEPSDDEEYVLTQIELETRRYYLACLARYPLIRNAEGRNADE